MKIFKPLTQSTKALTLGASRMKSFSFLTPFLTQALNFFEQFVCLFFGRFFELCILECKHGQYLDLFLRKDFELTIMNCEEDIEIAEVVRKFPALYDKQCKDYHRRDVQKNCWTSVALE